MSEIAEANSILEAKSSRSLTLDEMEKGKDIEKKDESLASKGMINIRDIEINAESIVNTKGGDSAVKESAIKQQPEEEKTDQYKEPNKMEETSKELVEAEETDRLLKDDERVITSNKGISKFELRESKTNEPVEELKVYEHHITHEPKANELIIINQPEQQPEGNTNNEVKKDKPKIYGVKKWIFESRIGRDLFPLLRVGSHSNG